MSNGITSGALAQSMDKSTLNGTEFAGLVLGIALYGMYEIYDLQCLD